MGQDLTRCALNGGGRGPRLRKRAPQTHLSVLSVLSVALAAPAAGGGQAGGGSVVCSAATGDFETGWRAEGGREARL